MELKQLININFFQCSERDGKLTNTPIKQLILINKKNKNKNKYFVYCILPPFQSCLYNIRFILFYNVIYIVIYTIFGDENVPSYPSYPTRLQIKIQIFHSHFLTLIIFSYTHPNISYLSTFQYTHPFFTHFIIIILIFVQIIIEKITMKQRYVVVIHFDWTRFFFFLFVCLTSIGLEDKQIMFQ